MGLVEDLLANTGTYVGIDTVTGTDLRGAARIVVTALPGNSGVTLDYEVLNPVNPDRIRAHVEHTMVARTAGGDVVMVIGHPHANSVAILRETSPGVFEPSEDVQAFPMKVELSVPEPSRILHTWWYGAPGGAAEPRDVSDVRRVD
jgi:hypothetical protein